MSHNGPAQFISGSPKLSMGWGIRNYIDFIYLYGVVHVKLKFFKMATNEKKIKILLTNKL